MITTLLNTATYIPVHSAMCFVGDILPNDSPVLRELLLDELASGEEQLQQTLYMLRAQRAALQQQIERYQCYCVLVTCSQSSEQILWKNENHNI